VVATSDPVGGAGAWHLSNIDGNNTANAVSCPSTSLCVAVDSNGNALTSTDPTGGGSAWTVDNVDAGASMGGVACPAVGLCVASDFAGYTLVGLGVPSATTGSAGSIGETTATLAGTVNPNGVKIDDCHFSYGIGSPAGTNVPCSTTPGAGTSDVSVSASLTGLVPGTTYQFRLVAKGAGGTTNGSVGMFTTLGVSLTITESGTGGGTVTSSPAGISCPGTTCSARFAHGASVTLTATAGTGSEFQGWSGGGCSGTATCNVTMTSDTAVTAFFSHNPPPTKCVVPKVKGKTLSAAKRAIKAHACSVGKVTHASSRKVKKGHVISQKPKPGSRLKHGAKVSLVVSRGR